MDSYDHKRKPVSSFSEGLIRHQGLKPVMSGRPGLEADGANRKVDCLFFHLRPVRLSIPMDTFIAVSLLGIRRVLSAKAPLKTTGRPRFTIRIGCTVYDKKRSLMLFSNLKRKIGAYQAQIHVVRMDSLQCKTITFEPGVSRASDMERVSMPVITLIQLYISEW